MASTVAQPKKCAGRRFERCGPFTAKGNRVLGRKAGHGLPPWKPSGHIHGRKGGKVCEKGKQVTTRREKNQKARSDQRAVNGAFQKIAGRSQAEIGLKFGPKLAVVLAHFGLTPEGMTKAQAISVAAQRARDAGLSVLPRLTSNPRLVAKPRPATSAHVLILGKEFYDTWEWKAARFVALKRHGRRCQCCGWSPGDSDGNYLVVDHIKPLRLFPQLALDPENHQVLCNDCNKGKSFRYTDDFRS